MSRIKTLKIKQLGREQVISRDGIAVMSCVFKNHGDGDAYIHFWSEPEADRVDEVESDLVICVPVLATIRIESFARFFPAGLCINVTDHPAGDFGKARNVEAQFQVIELRQAGSVAELIESATGA